MSSTMRGTMKSTMEVAWVAPPIHKGLEKSNTFFFCFRDVFAGANHQVAFPPWRAIGWFNTMTTGKRGQAANRIQSQLITPLELKKMTAASSDQRAIYY